MGRKIKESWVFSLSRMLREGKQAYEERRGIQIWTFTSVFWGCFNRVTNGVDSIIQIFCPTVLGAGSSKSRKQQGWFLLRL